MDPGIRREPVAKRPDRPLPTQGWPLKADSAAAAVSIYRAGTSPIDLVLTDVVMPDVSGPKPADKLVQIRPGIQVLFMSGYTDNVVLRHGILERSVNFIDNPFSPEQLVAKIREVLKRTPL